MPVLGVSLYGGQVAAQALRAAAATVPFDRLAALAARLLPAAAAGSTDR